MKAYTRRRLIAAGKLGLAAIPFFVALRFLHGNPWQGGVVVGFVGGFAVGVVELFLVRQRLARLRFLPYLAVKALLLSVVMYSAFVVLNLLDVVIDGIAWSEYGRALTDEAAMVGLGEALVVFTFLLFVVELDRRLGPGVLTGLLLGRYHRPRREERVFMFLDLKGSTGIAERMEAGRYVEFLRETFGGMSEAILESNAEIYQYVGDEVVLTWRMRDGVEEANCLRAFFRIDAQLKRRQEDFRRSFGVCPEFKAGVHAGEVVAAQIGDLKRETSYSGDVLSSAARIQGLCGELGFRLLASQKVISRVHLGSEYEIESLGAVSLRGRAEEVTLFGVRPRASSA